MAFNFKKKRRELERAKKGLPMVIGNMAKNHYLKSFREGGFTDKSFEAWEKRKTKNSSDRRTRRRRALLVDKGHMRRGVRVISANFRRIRVGVTGIPYAKYHNDPKKSRVHRPFIGESAVLTEKIKKRIRREVKKIL